MNRTGKVPTLVEVLGEMNQHFGTTLIEITTGAKPPDLILWVQGEERDITQEARLRFAHLVFSMLSDREGPELAVKAMCGMSPFLGDEPMFDAIRKDRYNDVITAVQGHLNGEFG